MKLEQNTSLGEFELDLGESSLNSFSEATGDDNDYAGFISPVVLVAKSIGTLLEKIEGSSGSIHISESVRSMRPVPVGAQVKVQIETGAIKSRMGRRFLTIIKNFEVGGEQVATAKTMLMLGEGQGE